MTWYFTLLSLFFQQPWKPGMSEQVLLGNARHIRSSQLPVWPIDRQLTQNVDFCLFFCPQLKELGVFFHCLKATLMLLEASIPCSRSNLPVPSLPLALFHLERFVSTTARSTRFIRHACYPTMFQGRCSSLPHS